MTAAPTAKMATPVGPVLGNLRWIRMDGKPPTGGMSCTIGMSLTDCIRCQMFGSSGLHSRERMEYTQQQHSSRSSVRGASGQCC
jgi:hypothetical protein